MTRSTTSESSVSESTFEKVESNPTQAFHPTSQPQVSANTRTQHSSNTGKMTLNTSHTGVYYLPVPGSKNAPKKFKGRFSEVKLFIKHYEKLCVQKKVIDPQEKIENITQYCSRQVREFMEGLPSYTKKNWEAFVQDLLEFYDADRDIKRYKRGDLEAFCKEMRHWKISMRLSHWKEFNRDFIRIASWLETHQKISVEETAIYYWKGIPQEFRNKLEARLLAINPDHDLELPFNVDQVNKVAKSFLQRNRFDSERIFSDNDSDEDNSDDSGVDSDSESDSDLELKKSILKWKKKREEKKKKSKDKGKKSVEFKDPVEEIMERPPSKSKLNAKSKSEEVENLIQQMNCLSINDPTYSVLYYRAYNLDPVIGDIMMKPVARQQLSRQIASNRVNEIRASSIAAQNSVLTSPTNNSGIQRELPPHIKPGANAFQQVPPSSNEERKCFGCRNMGHTIYSCTELSALVTKGIVVRGPTGRIIMADGTPIRKISFDEPLTAAIERMRPAQSNYVTFNEASAKSGVVSNSDSDNDEEVFIATRSMKKTNRPITERTRPQHKRFETGRARTNEKENSSPPVEKELEKDTIPTVPTPFSIDNTIFNAANEDELMEDDSPRDKISNVTETSVQKRPPKRSEIQSQVDQMNVLGRILSQPVTLAVGEVFGISKEMTANLREVLKPKPNPQNISQVSSSVNKKTNLVEVEKPFTGTAVLTRAKEMLIRLRMECDRKPITAIIDTGSQLNIARSDVWKTVLRRPIDTKSTVSMNDANGGESRLNGLVPNVPLNCGGVTTHANIYVGDNVPFELLLGRPWQRGNFVSIDEREDGTYLLFKDKDLDVRHEVLVTPEDIVVQDPYSHEYFSKPKKAVASVNAVFVKDNSQEIPMVVDESGMQMAEDGPNKSERRTVRDKQKPRYGISDDVEMTESEPPGLTQPRNLSEVQEMSQLWRRTALERTPQDNESNATCSRLGATRNLLEEDNWKLVQVLMKQNTWDWRRAQVKLKTYQVRIRQSSSGRNRDRTDIWRKSALENSKIRRLLALTKHLVDQADLASDQKPENGPGKPYLGQEKSIPEKIGTLSLFTTASGKKEKDLLIRQPPEVQGTQHDTALSTTGRRQVPEQLDQERRDTGYMKRVEAQTKGTAPERSSGRLNSIGRIEAMSGWRGQSSVNLRNQFPRQIGERTGRLAVEQRKPEEETARIVNSMVRDDEDVEMSCDGR